ncbi:MAG: Dihydrolipoyllysine-residue acetyltransferase component of pyruvate dehydrogenase complex [Holosporales bacterium]
MPALSPTMTEGNLVKWLKKEGDSIKAGQVLCEIETDKATMEVEAVDEGILGKIVVPEGAENVQVNALIAILCEDGEDPALVNLQGGKCTENDQKCTENRQKNDQKCTENDPKIGHKNAKSAENEFAQNAKSAVGQNEQNSENEFAQNAKSAVGQNGQSAENENVQNAKSAVMQNERIKASPLARRLGLQNQIDLKTVFGTGPNGRIVKIDVLEALKKETSEKASTPQEALFEDVKVSLMRKTVARRLSESKNTVPHFYLSVDCEIDKLLEMRAQINQALAQKVSVNDMLIKICAKTLQAVPKANVTWHETFMRYYSACDISVAVAVDGGLVTPIVFGCENLSVSEISKTMKALAEKARQGKLQPREYEGGSFTISNLGMFGIKQFNAIINPPQGCILAVGAGEKRVIVKNDQPTVSTIMTVTLSVDHRSVDGALGAEFLKVFKNFVENPILMFV